MPSPYNVIFGRDTALPSPLYHSGATGIDLMDTQTVFIQGFTLTFPSIHQPITVAFVLPTRSILSRAMLANW